MEFTGERYMPEEISSSDHMSNMHLERYKFAIPFVNHKEVMDIACGEGYGSNLLTETADKVTGIDIDPETIEYASKKYKKDNLFFGVGNVEKIEKPNESIDVIISFETIEHVKSKTQKKFIKEVWRVLKPGGIFIVSTPDKDMGGEGYNEFHLCELTKAQFLKLLKPYFYTIDLYGQDIKTYGNKFSLIIIRLLHLLIKIDKFKLRHKFFPKKLRLSVDNGVSNSAINRDTVNDHAYIPQKINLEQTANYLIAVCKK